MADCIAAISTPMASGGVSMIRISGADALKVAAKVFIPKYPMRDIEKMDGYTAAYGDITADGTKLDDRRKHSRDNLSRRHPRYQKGTAGGIIRRRSNGSGRRIYKAGTRKRQAVADRSRGCN